MARSGGVHIKTNGSWRVCPRTRVFVFKEPWCSTILDQIRILARFLRITEILRETVEPAFIHFHHRSHRDIVKMILSNHFLLSKVTQLLLGSCPPTLSRRVLQKPIKPAIPSSRLSFHNSRVFTVEETRPNAKLTYLCFSRTTRTKICMRRRSRAETEQTTRPTGSGRCGGSHVRAQMRKTYVGVGGTREWGSIDHWTRHEVTPTVKNMNT